VVAPIRHNRGYAGCALLRLGAVALSIADGAEEGNLWTDIADIASSLAAFGLGDSSNKSER
jgi:hypothetical protein